MVQDLAYMSGPLEAESESEDEQTKEAPTLRQTKHAPDPEQMKQAPIPEQAMEAPDPEQTKETPTVEQTKEAQTKEAQTEAPTKEAPTKEAPTKEAPAISAAQRVMPEIKMKDGMPCYVTAEGGTIFGYVLADASADGLAQAKFPGMSEPVEIPGMMFEKRPVKKRQAGAMMRRPAAKRPAKAGTTKRARLEDEQAEEKEETAEKDRRGKGGWHHKTGKA